MRLLVTLAIILIGLALSAPGYATDEFGARFHEVVPEALSDPEQALADIMPAAGEEDDEEEQSSQEDDHDEDEESEESDEDERDEGEGDD